MKRMLGLLAIVSIAAAGAAQAQGGMGGGRMMQMPDHWLSADSVAKAVGVTDAAVIDRIKPHLAEVDKVMADAAAERRKMMEARQAGGGPPDPATMQAMREKMDGYQKSVDTHLGAVREALPEANRAAFDALQKPNLRPRRPGGMGGGPPGGR